MAVRLSRRQTDHRADLYLVGITGQRRELMHSTHLSLIARVRDSADQKSWAEFTELYKPLLMSYVRKKGLRDHDAEDVVQNVLIQLLHRLQQFELDHTRGRFRTFLWQVTNFAVIDWLRRKKGRELAEQNMAAELRTFEDAATRAPDVDWVHEERQRIVAFAIEQAQRDSQPRTWQCFELHILKGTPAAQVARTLGFTTNAVYVNASRILSRVRTKCLEYDEGLSDD